LNNRQRQAIKTKLKITKVTAELFKNSDGKEITIREICEAASISVGTFYHHFTSKEEIVAIGYEQMDLLMAEEIDKYGPTGSIDEIAEVYLKAGELIQELGWTLSAHSYTHFLFSKNKYTLQQSRPVFQFTLKRLNQAIQNSKVTEETNPETVAETIVRISRGTLLDWCLREGCYPLGEKLKEDILLVLNNYRKN